MLKADDRANSSDEEFFKNLVKPYVDEEKPFFFVLNQVDKIEPFREWNEEKGEPGTTQFQNIDRKIYDVSSYFGVPRSKIIEVSANEKYNLTQLVDEIVYSLPKEKQIGVFKEIAEEYKSEDTENRVKRGFFEIVKDTIVNISGDIWDNITILKNPVEFVSDLASNAKLWFKMKF